MTPPERFPIPLPIIPTNLIKSVNALPDYDSESPFEMSQEYWELLNKKILSGGPLSDHEKTLFINNSNRFSDHALVAFRDIFLRNLSSELLKRTSRHLNCTLFPTRSLQILLDPKLVSNFGKQHLTIGLQNRADLLMNSTDNSVWELILKETESPLIEIRNFGIDENRLTSGQCEIIRIWFNSPFRTRLFLDCYDDLWSWATILESQISDQLRCIDSIVGEQMDKQPNWNATLLDKSSHFGRLIPDLLRITNSQHISLTNYRALDLALREYFNLIEALKELSRIVPQRGEFWGAHLSKCSKVQTKKFNEQRVAVAMTFGKTTIVEFGPVGNAALIYETSDFENLVSKSATWRNKDLLKRLPTFQDGRIVHFDGWMRRASDLLRYLLAGGNE